MFVQTLFIADTEGNVLSSLTHPRRVAAYATHAVANFPHGQPVLTDRAEVFARPAR
jgi:hypothetical protein